MAKRSALEEAGFREEVAEEFLQTTYGNYVKTGFPQPWRRFKLAYESQQASVEHTYFWIYTMAKQDMGFSDIVKTVDTFAASENSSFWGMTEQRKSIQQDKASQYLATIGRMVKELFQIVREIRILKERLRLYHGVTLGRQADDIALKGYWVDMVEGGTKGQANIYTMAQQLGFGTLPDLFFSTFVRKPEDVNDAVEDKAKEFNSKVKEVLKRKLAQYMAWKVETQKELETRERFTLRYLRQHWAIIRMYMSWVKPYLRNVQKLQAPDKYDKNPELISSFEGALMEIEFLAKRGPTKDKVKGRDGKMYPIHPVLLATFNYRVRPQLSFQADSYQNRGAVHVGKVEFSLRSYAWTQEDIDAYVRFREQETLELISAVDQSVRDAMDALGDELLKFLKEAGEIVEVEEKVIVKEKKEPMPDILEPFKAVFDGFVEMASLPFGSLLPAHKEGPKQYRGEGKAHSAIASRAAFFTFLIYKNYKKAHGMPQW
jgi:hypothetical protein